VFVGFHHCTLNIIRGRSWE